MIRYRRLTSSGGPKRKLIRSPPGKRYGYDRIKVVLYNTWQTRNSSVQALRNTFLLPVIVPDLQMKVKKKQHSYLHFQAGKRNNCWPLSNSSITFPVCRILWKSQNLFAMLSQKTETTMEKQEFIHNVVKENSPSA